jgi:hypothetical protein
MIIKDIMTPVSATHKKESTQRAHDRTIKMEKEKQS